jgi:hypothetical protein
MMMVMAWVIGVVACTNGDRRDKGDVRVRTGGVDGGESGEGNDEPRSSLLGVCSVDTVGALPPCEAECIPLHFSTPPNRS